MAEMKQHMKETTRQDFLEKDISVQYKSRMLKSVSWESALIQSAAKILL